MPFGAGVVIIGQAPLPEQEVDKTPGEIQEPSSLHVVPGR